MSLSRALVILFAAALIAGCSVEPLPVPSTPLQATTGPSPAGTPQLLPPELREFDDILISAYGPDQELLVGALWSGWRRLGTGGGDTTVVDAWGRVVLTNRDRGEIIVSILERADASPVEVYRTSDGADATTYATTNPDGTTLVIYGGSIATRVVDLRTGAQTDFPPAPFGLGGLTLHWSPDGTSFVSGECDTSKCQSRVVELESLRAIEIRDFVPHALGGGHLVGYRNQADRQVLLLDVASGERRPVAAVIDGFYSAMALSETRFLVYGTAGDSYGFVLLDTESGTDTLVAIDPLLRFPVDEFVDPDWVVLQPRDPSTVRVDPGTTLDLLDLATGRITEDVIQVPPAP